MEMMRPFVIKEPGGPEKLELREVPRPTPRDGWVLIRNRAFGLNLSEWFTRRGESPSVEFLRVLVDVSTEAAKRRHSREIQGFRVTGGL